ncbi:MAG: thioredoxin domain-containing protein, partial [Thermoplasmata archaeon]|nr:thioredoxin domain-containing protein [Thermoplasmata archaeon]
SALRLVRDAMGSAPTGFGLALCALDLHLGPAREVAIVGDPAATDTLALAAAVTSEVFRPNVVLAVGAPGDDDARASVPLLRDRITIEGAATAYVCERFTCKLPVTDVDALRAQLEA